MTVNYNLNFPGGGGGGSVSSDLNLDYAAFPENTVDTTTISGLSASAVKWWGGALADNDKIYCAPRHADSVLIIDTNTNTADTTTIPVSVATNKWLGCVYAAQ